MSVEGRGDRGQPPSRSRRQAALRPRRCECQASTADQFSRSAESREIRRAPQKAPPAPKIPTSRRCGSLVGFGGRRERLQPARQLFVDAAKSAIRQDDYHVAGPQFVADLSHNGVGVGNRARAFASAVDAGYDSWQIETLTCGDRLRTKDACDDDLVS